MPDPVPAGGPVTASTEPPPGARVSAPTMAVGVVGIGAMGLPVVGNLIRAGFPVFGYRRSVMPDEFHALGARETRSVAELSATCGVVLVLLPDPEALLTVTLDPGGLLDGAHPGLVVVEMSTMPLAVKERCRAALAERGVPMLDAPISGMPGMVTARTAAIFASGDDDALDSVRPVLEAVAGRVDHLGPFGAGSQTKFIAQQLLAVHTLVAAEALGLARRAGLDLDRLFDTLAGTIAGSAALSARGSRMIHGPYRPAPGPVATLQEGLQIVGAFADDLKANTPLLHLALQLYGEALSGGHGDDDLSVMIDVLNTPREFS